MGYGLPGKLNPAVKNAVTISIKQVTGYEDIQACQELMLKVFHTELGYRAMSFPDNYEDSSIYVAIRSASTLAGTFRIVKPKELNQCPAAEVWPEANNLPAGSICQFSRIVIHEQYRRRGLFSLAVKEASGIAIDVGAALLLSEVLLQSQVAYGRCGFEVVGEAVCDETVDIGGTREVNCVPMVLRLDNIPL